MPKNPRNRSNEHHLQVNCVKWFRYAYGKYSRLLYAIPNGGQRNKAVAGKLKSEGVVRGVPDLFLSVPNSRYHGFYIEMKYGNNKLTPDQIEFRTEAMKLGYKYIVCRSFDEFKPEIDKYLSEL